MKAAIPMSLLLLLSGCAALKSDPDAVGPPAVPPEYQAACGHPGAVVTVTHVPYTIAHTQCDLTGVTLIFGLAQAAVPKPGATASTIADTFAPTDQPTRISVAVDAKTLDVTVTGD